MILLLRGDLPPEARHGVIRRLERWASANGASLRGPASAGAGGPLELVLAAGQAEESCSAQLRAMEGVEAVLTAATPTHRVQGSARTPQVVRVGEAQFGGGAAACIAGPCAVEDEAELLSLARRLRALGVTALRGGAFKPRTSPYAFQGLGRRGLDILAAVARASGLPVVTEVLDPRDVALVAERAAVLQIGSRNMMNYALLREAGAAGKPVLLKRGMSATLAEFLQAAEYLAEAGAREILLCERGLRHFDPALRNLLDLSAVPALHERTGLPVLVDPSHATGRAALVPAMLAAAAAAGADGFLVEVHPDPPRAWSDAEQALDPDTFAGALRTAEAVLLACGRRLARPQSTVPA